MDVIAAIRYAILSPFIAFAVVSGLFFPIKYYFKPNSYFGDLLMKCFIFAAIFAGISLAGVIGQMVLYSYQTGPQDGDHERDDGEFELQSVREVIVADSTCA